ncbi:hypothetical protein GCM10027034_18240 [Ramlibacter solisilvae]
MNGPTPAPARCTSGVLTPNSVAASTARKPPRSAGKSRQGSTIAFTVAKQKLLSEYHQTHWADTLLEPGRVDEAGLLGHATGNGGEALQETLKFRRFTQQPSAYLPELVHLFT